MERAGQQIAGSRMFRAYCIGCKGAMRVVEYIGPGEHMCHECDGTKEALMPPPLGVGDDIDNNGYWHDVVHALDGD